MGVLDFFKRFGRKQLLDGDRAISDKNIEKMKKMGDKSILELLEKMHYDKEGYTVAYKGKNIEIKMNDVFKLLEGIPIEEKLELITYGCVMFDDRLTDEKTKDTIRDYMTEQMISLEDDELKANMLIKYTEHIHSRSKDAKERVWSVLKTIHDEDEQFRAMERVSYLENWRGEKIDRFFPMFIAEFKNDYKKTEAIREFDIKDKPSAYSLRDILDTYKNLEAMIEAVKERGLERSYITKHMKDSRFQNQEDTKVKFFQSLESGDLINYYSRDMVENVSKDEYKRVILIKKEMRDAVSMYNIDELLEMVNSINDKEIKYEVLEFYREKLERMPYQYNRIINSTTKLEGQKKEAEKQLEIIDRVLLKMNTYKARPRNGQEVNKMIEITQAFHNNKDGDNEYDR